MDPFKMIDFQTHVKGIFLFIQNRIVLVCKKSVVVLSTFILCQSIIITPCYSFSIGDEREVGQELLYTIRKVVNLVDEPDVHQYFKKLGGQVLTVADGRYFDYRFFIINNNEFNAFAAPSGLIFINTGLIEATKTEDELVSVLSHEVAHAVSRHIASQIEKGTIVSLASIGLALAALALGGGEATQALFVGSFAAAKSFQLHFNREGEEEADRLADEWMKKMGRNPKEMVTMLRSMRRITKYKMGKNIPPYLLTHPDPDVRLDYVQNLLEKDKGHLVKREQTSQFDFLRMKYRVLSIVKDSETFRNHLAIKIKDKESSTIDVIMAKYGLAQIDRMQNNYESSLSLIDEVIRFFPHKPVLFTDKGVVEYEAGHFKKALVSMEEARSRNHDDIYATFQLSKLYAAKENYKLADHYLMLVAAALPEYPGVYFELGKSKSRQKKPGDSEYYLGKYNLYLGRMKLATENFKRAKKTKGTSEKLKKDAEEMLKIIKIVKDN